MVRLPLPASPGNPAAQATRVPLELGFSSVGFIGLVADSGQQLYIGTELGYLRRRLRWQASPRYAGYTTIPRDFDALRAFAMDLTGTISTDGPTPMEIVEKIGCGRPGQRLCGLEERRTYPRAAAMAGRLTGQGLPRDWRWILATDAPDGQSLYLRHLERRHPRSRCPDRHHQHHRRRVRRSSSPSARMEILPPVPACSSRRTSPSIPPEISISMTPRQRGLPSSPHPPRLPYRYRCAGVQRRLRNLP